MNKLWLALMLCVAVALVWACDDDDEVEDFLDQFEKECTRLMGILFDDCGFSDEEHSKSEYIEACQESGGLTDCMEDCRDTYNDEVEDGDETQCCVDLVECLQPCYEQ